MRQTSAISSSWIWHWLGEENFPRKSYCATRCVAHNCLFCVRLEDGDTVVDLEVVSLCAIEDFDAGGVRDAVERSLDLAIISGNMGKETVSSVEIGQFRVDIPEIGRVKECLSFSVRLPPPLSLYIFCMSVFIFASLLKE